MYPEYRADIERAAVHIREAEALVICAGAGMGVDSGLPDFRGDEGFWRAYPPYRQLKVSFVEMAQPQWFRRDPEFAWGFYGHRLNLYRRTKPHDGFRLLREWGQAKPGGYFVFTSNVDGQFQQAGFSEEGIEECHGSIHHLQCLAGCRNEIWPADDVRVEVDESTMRARPPLPSCERCGSPARPNVLMFGDWDWIPDRSLAQDERFQAWLSERRKMSFVVVECGAGTAVPSVRAQSARLCSHFNAALIRINTREPEVPPGHIGLPMGARTALQEIHQQLD
ncbi:MAG: NAD-dependent protein deacetylase [Acidobacteria bacterium]|nr:NAD-dependent protein deacetylase [Acidobacteriota bacterium]